MPHPFQPALILLTLVLLHGCTAPEPGSSPGSEAERPGTPDETVSVWAVDLVRTLPDQHSAYLRSIETNWAGARRLARERGAVLSYRALAAGPDTARGWDVILMTEYADSASWAAREEIFQEIFGSLEFVAVETERPSSELREFEVGGVVMREVASAEGAPPE